MEQIAGQENHGSNKGGEHDCRYIREELDVIAHLKWTEYWKSCGHGNLSEMLIKDTKIESSFYLWVNEGSSKRGFFALYLYCIERIKSFICNWGGTEDHWSF